MHKLLREQPHLRFNSGEFREMFVLRSIYVVGPDAAMIANYTGYRKSFVDAVRSKYQQEALKAYRAWINGSDYEKTIIESVKDVVRTVKRAVEKRTLRKQIADFARRIGFSRKVQGPFGSDRRTEARNAR